MSGSRRIATYDIVKAVLSDSPFQISAVLSGGAGGVDRLAWRWADENSVPVEEFPLDWKTYGKAAPLVRNCEMSSAADAFIAVWDGHSTGTLKMIEAALAYRLPVFVHMVEEPWRSWGRREQRHQQQCAP